MNTENWKWFKVGALFTEIYKAKAHIKQEVNITNDKSKGLIFVSRTETNNGCDVLIERDDRVIIEAGNAIIIGDTTATCFYQEKEFTTGDHIIICRSNWLNKYTALFFKTIMDNEKYRFNYGRAFKMELVREHRIKLPAITNKNGDTVPDWQWMEDYAKNTLLPQLPMKTRQVWDKRYNNQPLSAQKLELKVEEWKWFKLPKIFSQLQKCKCSNATELLEEGTDIAYIGAKKNDNGVMQYVQYNADLVTKGHCIVLIGDGQGSVGYSLYQPKDFIGSTTLIAGYSEHLNPYTAQFLVAIIDQDRYRYSFGRKFNLTAINKTMLKLPATTNKQGEIVPDWQWMEDYIKGLPFSGAL